MLSRCRRLDELISKRNQVAEWYNQRIPEIPGIETPTIATYTTKVSWFVYVVRFTQGLDRDNIAKKLGALGIPARPYFLPIHLQPYIMERFGYSEGIFPVTRTWATWVCLTLLGGYGRRSGRLCVPDIKAGDPIASCLILPDR